MENLKKRNIILIFILFAFGFIALPGVVLSASLYFSSSSQDIYKDDVFVVEARISSSDEFINAAEGVLLFDNSKLEVKELSTGGSIFSLWLELPVFSNEDGEVSFTGGVPGGFQGDDALIFKIVFLAKDKGDAKVDFRNDTLLFLNDGKGTRIDPELKPIVVPIFKRLAEAAPKDEWQAFIEQDITLPEPFEIIVSQDPSIFDNQYFISFFTTDTESGIAYYEVKEGERNFVRAEIPYLLKDQSLRNLIKVNAIDKAGNARTVELMPSIPSAPFDKNVLVWIAALLIVVLLAFYILWGNFRREIKIQK